MSSEKKILCLLPHRPDRSPGQRFRIEQYLKFLSENGFLFTIRYLISEKDDTYIYKNGYYFRKLLFFILSILKQYKNLQKANEFDAVFIYRELLLHGSTYFEKQLHKKNIPIIYDFDDALWLIDTSEANEKFKWLKSPSKLKKILKYSKIVIAGNEYLANYAKQFCNDVRIIPTTLDTNLYKPLKHDNNSNIIRIGWSGSNTTFKHLKAFEHVLYEIYKKYNNKIRFCIISNHVPQITMFPFEFIPWSAKTEIQDVGSFNIGIMPLPDNPWTRGKCGFKGLLYMSLGIPTIMSAVGVNTEIIQDNVNGFLAHNENEWIEKLSLLIEDESLRKRLGAEGRRTVELRYSFEAHKNEWLKVFQDATFARTFK